MDKIYIILLVLAAVILLGIVWCLTEAFILDHDRASLKRSPNGPSSDKEVTVKKLKGSMNAPSDGPADLRFFFFSDLHAELCPITVKRLCNAIKKSHDAGAIDAVIFGGDITTYPGNSKMGFKYLSQVSSFCKELGIPFYGVSGNHDYYYNNAPEECGFISLDAIEVALTSHISGRKIILTGLSDSGKKNRVWHTETAVQENDPVILIVHDPDAFIHLEPQYRPDFMLSGHLHGGQMKLPFRMEFLVLRKSDQLPRMGAVQGVYDLSGTSVFISRGLGCGILPFRFLSLPEATVVEIKL